MEEPHLKASLSKGPEYSNSSRLGEYEEIFREHFQTCVGAGSMADPDWWSQAALLDETAQELHLAVGDTVPQTDLVVSGTYEPRDPDDPSPPSPASALGS